MVKAGTPRVTIEFKFGIQNIYCILNLLFYSRPDSSFGIPLLYLLRCSGPAERTQSPPGATQNGARRPSRSLHSQRIAFYCCQKSEWFEFLWSHQMWPSAWKVRKYWGLFRTIGYCRPMLLSHLLFVSISIEKGRYMMKLKHDG